MKRDLGTLFKENLSMAAKRKALLFGGIPNNLILNQKDRTRIKNVNIQVPF